MSYDLCLHVDANDPALLAFAFVNALNYMNGLPGKEFELVLVANGPAVKLFVPAQAELQKTAEELMARGLKLRLCKNALDANKMTAADLWPGCEVVPAGLVEIVELQNRGFAYIRPYPRHFCPLPAPSFRQRTTQTRPSPFRQGMVMCDLPSCKDRDSRDTACPFRACAPERSGPPAWRAVLWFASLRRSSD